MINSEKIPNKTSNNSSFPQSTLITQVYSPLPPPEMLAKYESVYPGLIDKIIEMSEAESIHRRELEKQKITAEVNNLHQSHRLISKAQIFALILAIITVIGGCISAIKGAQIAASFIGTSGVVGIIIAFLKNSKQGK